MSAALEASIEEPPTGTDILAPLRFFYGLGSESPRVTFLTAAEMPATERWLLVHSTDMTPRLREHHNDTIILDVHAKSRIGDYLVRASVLKRQQDLLPVEFGAIGIHLGGFDLETRELILSGHLPLGGILQKMQVPHSSHPCGYFRIEIDHRLASLLDAVEGQTLYGRCNELRHGNGSPLAEVVEVLPLSAS
jgi:hypothetical protein